MSSRMRLAHRPHSRWRSRSSCRKVDHRSAVRQTLHRERHRRTVAFRAARGSRSALESARTDVARCARRAGDRRRPVASGRCHEREDPAHWDRAYTVETSVIGEASGDTVRGVAAVTPAWSCGGSSSCSRTRCSSARASTARLVDAIRDLDGVTVHDLYEAYPTSTSTCSASSSCCSSTTSSSSSTRSTGTARPRSSRSGRTSCSSTAGPTAPGGTRAARQDHAATRSPPAAPSRRTSKGGYNRFTMRELLAPCDQTAHLCGMRFLAPFVVHAAPPLGRRRTSRRGRASYRRLIEALRDGRLDLESRRASPRTSHDLDALIAAVEARMTDCPRAGVRLPRRRGGGRADRQARSASARCSATSSPAS